MKSFPEGFLWGAATSAHQVEGGNHNDWSEWEKSDVRSRNLEVRMKDGNFRKSFPANILNVIPSPLDPANYISGAACDHYHRFEEDFDIAKSLGHNAHRFSIEWSRIEPEEGKFDEKEIEHYRKVIAALRARGIEPFVTLWHWTLPLWMRDKGGVISPEFPMYFARYAKFAVSRLKKEVTFWMTLNEPTSVIYNAYFHAAWPPQEKSILKTWRAYRILARAHREAYRAMHDVHPEAQIGFANIMGYIEPASRSFLDGLAAWHADFWTNRCFLWLTGNTHDYLALQYYFHRRMQFPAKDTQNDSWTSDMGWGIYPEGIYHILRRLKKYQKPIYITENGVADSRDVHRAKFIRDHLTWVHKATSESMDVRGYFYWSLLDNFEWDKGFWPRFGLVEVDYKTLARKIRPSAYEYKRIIEQNGLPDSPNP